MEPRKAGRVNGVSHEQSDQDKPLCLHQRMVAYEYDEQGQSTGHLICRECHAVIADPFKTLG